MFSVPAIRVSKSGQLLHIIFNVLNNLDNTIIRAYINSVRLLLIFEVLIIFILLKITSALHKKIKTVTERNHGRPTKL